MKLIFYNPKCVCVVLSRFSCVQLSGTLWNIAHQAPLQWNSPRRILEWVAISFSRVQFHSRVQLIFACKIFFQSTYKHCMQTERKICMYITLPDSSVHGILQARILELVAIPFSRESSQTRDRTH